MDGIKIQIIDERSPYLKQVVELGDRNQKTLGFFEKGAFYKKARQKMILVAVNSQEQLFGYLMYDIRRKDRYVKLIHLCINEQHRGQKITKKLVENLKQRTLEYQGISLDCRRDYQIDPMWISLGFVSQGEKPAKTKDRFLTNWWLDYGQPNLFSNRDRQLTESSLCVMLDLAIFEELCLVKEQFNTESKSLLADWLDSDLTLCITDEVFYKINSIENSSQREILYNLTSRFTKLDYNNLNSTSAAVLAFCKKYKLALTRFNTNHLIKTIASQLHIFITHNASLLARRDEFYDCFQLSLKTPTELILQLDELSNKPHYQPIKLAGTQLKIIRLEIGEEAELIKHFGQEETTAEFYQKIRRFITESDRFECWAIWDGNNLIGLYVYGRHNNYELEIPLLRIKDNNLAATLAYHSIYQATLISARENRQFTKITDLLLSDRVIEAIQQENAFIKVNNAWLRANFALVDTKSNLLNRVINSVDKSSSEYARYRKVALSFKNDIEDTQSSNLLDLERLFFPAKISDAEIPTFIVPIKPYWAQQLFDANLSSQTLFGASKIELALNKEAVYYKNKNAPKSLKPGITGRVLWYISKDKDPGFTGTSSIRACSILEGVIIGKPLDLYRRFRNLGIYSDRDILKVAKGDREKEIMALRFSHTELFNNPISFNRIRETVGKKITMVNATLIDKEHFASIYILGTKKSN